MGKEAILVAAFASAMMCSTGGDACAQTTADREPQPAPFFVGGSLMFSSRHREITDPPGSGYLHPLFHGSLDWPSAGATFIGGALVAPSWSIGAEVALRSAKSTAILEDTQAGHFQFILLSSTYTDRERLYSVVMRRHVVGRVIELQPLVGFTASHNTQTLTNRRGASNYAGVTRPAQTPDASAARWRPGLVGGTDLVFHAASGIAVNVGTRLHWIRRERYDEYEREFPHAGSIVLSFGAGLSWQPRARRSSPSR